MVQPIPFTLTAAQMPHVLAWRAQVEAPTRRPIDGVVCSCLVRNQGELPRIVRPSTDQDFKRPNVPRTEGTYDTLAPHDEVLATSDHVGFASTDILWRDVGIPSGCARGACWGGGRCPGATWNVWTSRTGRSSPCRSVISLGCWQRLRCAPCSPRRPCPGGLPPA
jgi:hypothetical protein